MPEPPQDPGRSGGPPSRELVQALRNGPFELAVQLAVRDSGLSLERIEHRLARRGIRVSASSLSNWQTGRSRPERAESLRALRAVEELLGLAPDSLLRLAGPKRARGRWTHHVPGSVPHTALFDHRPGLASILDELDADSRFRMIGIDETVSVDRYHRIRTVRVRQLITAQANGLDRCHVYFHADDGPLPDIVPVRGNRIGRTRTGADRIAVAEVLLDHHLDRDEVHLVEFEFRFAATDHSPDPRRGDHYYRVFRQPCRQYLLRIRFDRAATPLRCHGFHGKRIGAAFVDDCSLPAQPGRVVTRYVENCSPGIAGVRWEWE